MYIFVIFHPGVRQCHAVANDANHEHITASQGLLFLNHFHISSNQLSVISSHNSSLNSLKKLSLNLLINDFGFWLILLAISLNILSVIGSQFSTLKFLLNFLKNNSNFGDIFHDSHALVIRLHINCPAAIHQKVVAVHNAKFIQVSIAKSFRDISHFIANSNDVGSSYLTCIVSQFSSTIGFVNVLFICSFAICHVNHHTIHHAVMIIDICNNANDHHQDTGTRHTAATHHNIANIVLIQLFLNRHIVRSVRSSFEWTFFSFKKLSQYFFISHQETVAFIK